MDYTKVFIIYNQNKYEKSDIYKELAEEQYPHCFVVFVPYNSKLNTDTIMYADEIWCFGDCESLEEYKLAKDCNKDIWQMG